MLPVYEASPRSGRLLARNWSRREIFRGGREQEKGLGGLIKHKMGNGGRQGRGDADQHQKQAAQRRPGGVVVLGRGSAPQPRLLREEAEGFWGFCEAPKGTERSGAGGGEGPEGAQQQ